VRDQPSEPFSRAAIWLAVALVALLAVGVVVIGKLLDSGSSSAPAPTTPPTTPSKPPQTGPIALVPVDAPDATKPACARLIGALPAELTSGSATLRRLPLADPAPPATQAWGATGEPVVLRCGLPRPPELTPSSGLRDVSGVGWLVLTGDGASTWYTADREVFVALTVPADAGTGPLQRISETIAATLSRV
jgi:hypothetical protein